MAIWHLPDVCQEAEKAVFTGGFMAFLLVLPEQWIVSKTVDC